VCVREVSQVGLQQAGIELQVVILDWLETAAKLAVHLAQVSQVDYRATGLAGHLSFRFSFNLAIKTAKTAKRRWRAALTAGFPGGVLT
jgi:hypothetical protein